MYAGLGRMLTGEEEPVDPRMARMQKLESIMAKIPEPDTYDEYIQLANLMNQAGLYGDAQEAMKMANEIKSSQPAKSNAWKEYTDMTSNPTPEGFQIWYDKYKVTGGSSGYTTLKKTNTLGQNVTETYETVNGQIVPGSQPVATQITSEPDTSVDLEVEEYEANLEPYVTLALASIKSETGTTGLMTEEAMLAEARKQGIRAYSKVEDASKNQTDGTAFIKNVDFFMSQKGADDTNLYTLDQAIAKATSLDHTTVDEDDMKLQNKAILDDEVVMASAEHEAAKNERLNNQMLSLLNNIETGKWEEIKYKASQWLGDFDGDLADKEMFFSLSTAKVMEYTAMTKGAISDAEMTLFQQAAMSLGKTTEGNRMLLRFAQEGVKATQRMAKHMRKWKIEEKARRKAEKLPAITFAEYETQKEVYRNSAENAAYFKAIINEDWKNAQDIGDSLSINEDLDAMRSDESSKIFAHCEKFPNDTICNM
jgi:hypothetical protein